MTALLLAAAIACSTSTGNLTLVREVQPESASDLGLPYARQWVWLALEGERIKWGRGQVLSLSVGGRVVRARTLLLKSPDLQSGLELGRTSVDVPASDFARKRSKDGRLGVVVFAGFDQAVPLGSVTEIRVGVGATP